MKNQRIAFDLLVPAQYEDYEYIEAHIVGTAVVWVEMLGQDIDGSRGVPTKYIDDFDFDVVNLVSRDEEGNQSVVTTINFEDLKNQREILEIIDEYCCSKVSV
jgi:hypothetical protein